MEIAIFKKVKKTKEGREFDTYFTKIDDVFYDVRFSEQRKCKAPDVQYPCNIKVNPGDVSVKTEVLQEGKHAGETFRRLYVYNYEMGSPFVDHSADYLFGNK